MYSPTKEEYNVRIGNNKKPYVIKLRRKIKSKEELKNLYKSNPSDIK
jgi:hypothetical protein